MKNELAVSGRGSRATCGWARRGAIAALGMTLVACGGATVTEGLGDGGASSRASSRSSASATSRTSASTSVGTTSTSASSAPTSGSTSTQSGTTSVSATSSSSASSSREAPTNHRANDSQCLQAPAAGDCGVMGDPSPQCSSDTQCTAGVNGRCVESNGGALFCSCTYDTCKDDSACTRGSTCACHGSPYTNGGNTCVQGNCRVDSDCGTGGFCSPSPSTGGCGGLGGYYCHTPDDQCVNDADCSGGGFGEGCVYQTTSGSWKCQQLPECG